MAIRPGVRPHGVGNATISASGSIQERIFPLRTGNELARTVAVRRTHQPSHYAMLGVARNFTEAQLKRQHRLLSLRYHPDAAERNGVDPEQAAERFKAMQTAYEALREPGRRARYDVEMRLQRQRLWRGAWSAPPMQIVDKTGAPTGEAAATAEAACGGGGAEAAAGSESLVRAKLRALQAEERAMWLQAELEEMQRKLAAVAFEKETQELQSARQADRERREAARREAKEAERNRRREAEKARRRAEEKLRREAEEHARVEAHERALEEAEAMTQDMEDRVRRQVEERAVRHGTELGRRAVLTMAVLPMAPS